MPTLRHPSPTSLLFMASLLGFLGGCAPTAPADDDDDGPDTGVCGWTDVEWSSTGVNFEREVLALVNEARALGADCGSEGVFPPVPALEADLCLADAARLHAQDMGENDYFSHDSQDGRSAADRVQDAGYSWAAVGENIAAGSPTPADAVQGWLGSDGHCRNIMSDSFTELGVGYFAAPESAWDHYWVQSFGRPGS